MSSEIPAPFVFSPSQVWDGNDGHWSTFIVRVGSQEQSFRVIPSTASQKTIVPLPEGCNESDPASCGDDRGVFVVDGHSSSGFFYNQSTTWDYIGLYELSMETHLNYTGGAIYGFDSVGLDAANSGGVSLSRQVVGGVATKDYFLGHFGLDQKPTNFSNMNDPQPSFLRAMRNDKKIPSMSYGYTAGAYYQTPPVLGSLVLGGYDDSRRKHNNISFPFDSNDSRLLSLTIQSIDATNTPQGVVTLSNSPTYATIDSTVSHIWLPEKACDEFERVFGLQFDSRTQLYIVNTTTHDRLKQLNPSINLQLGTSRNPTKVVNINLPYGAFDLQAGYPMYPNATNYFPIRRAANETQFTLGRAFLQEAYLITDYEHRNFSVSQATFESPLKERIVPIVSEEYAISTQNKQESKHGDPNRLSKATLPGIVIGTAILVLTCTFASYFFFAKKWRLKKARKSQERSEQSSGVLTSECAEFPDTARHEMDPAHRVAELNRTSVFQAEGDDVANELHNTSNVELEGWEAHEIEGSRPPLRLHEMDV